MVKKITIKKDMLVQNIINKYPESILVLMGYGLHCVGCVFANSDTIESGAKLHGFDNETIDFMISDINKVLNNAVEIFK
jgi:hybrid cluster-associated redox disulfide protein